MRVVSRTINVAALSIGRWAGLIINLGVTVVMTRFLLPNELATYRQTFLAYATLSPFLTLGVSEGLYYFLPKEDKRVRGRVLDGLLVLATTGAVFGLFLAAGGNEILAQRFSNPPVARMLLWMIPFSVLTTPSQLFASVFITQHKALFVSAFAISRQLLVGLATLLPLLCWRNFEAPLIGNIVASILVSLVSIYLIISSSTDTSGPSLTGISELICFSVPLALATMADSLSQQLDKVFVALLGTPEEFAVYSIGAMEIPLIGAVTGSVSVIMLTDLRRAISDGDEAEAVRLFNLTAEKTSLLLFPAFFYFFIVAESFMTVLYTSTYAASAIPFRWYLLILPIRTAYLSSLILAIGNTRFILTRSILSLIFNCIFTYIFIIAIGIDGAAVASVLVKYLWAVPVSLIMLSGSLERRWWELIPFDHYLRICLELTPLICVSFGVHQLVPDHGVRLAAITACFAIFLFFWWDGRLYSIKSIRQRFFTMKH